MENRTAGPADLEPLFRAALACDECFAGSYAKVKRADGIELPQPRPVPPGYWTSNPRVAVVQINPSAGKPAVNAETNRRLIAIRDGIGTFEELGEYNLMKPLNRMRRGLYRIYEDGLGLNRHEIALPNIAWCATAENKYPRGAMDRCFNEWTRTFLALLDPDVICLAGRATHRFYDDVCVVCRGAEVVKVLHCSHLKGYRKAGGAEAKMIADLKVVIDRVRQAHKSGDHLQESSHDRRAIVT